MLLSRLGQLINNALYLTICKAIIDKDELVSRASDYI